MSSITRDEFLSAKTQVIEPVLADEIRPGAVIHVRSLSAAERGQFIKKAQRFKESGGKQYPNFIEEADAEMVVMAACDENGAQLFSRDDIPLIKAKNAALIGRISLKAQTLAGLTKEDLEALEKNSETTQSGDSNSN